MSAYDLARAAQALAADPHANVFVTANAGSGKTKVLIDRIVRLLLIGARPSSFVCITYTKAAAAEMQRRLIERLGGWCVAPDDALRAALGELSGAPVNDEDLPRARALFARALETPGGLKIQTIHAFCERLIARFPLEAGVWPGFAIAEEARAAALLADARAALCAAGDGETMAAFARFAAKLDGERLDTLLSRLAVQDAEGGDWAALLRRHNAAEGDAVAQFLAAAPWSEIADAADVMRQSTTNNVKVGDALAAALAARARNDNEAAWSALTDACLTGEGKARANAPTATLRASEPWLDRLFSDAGLTGALLTAAEAKRAAERAADAHAAIVLSCALARAYEREKAQAGVLDFADLVARAQALLARSQAAPWVLYKLDGGIDHILVDEGQDTSPEQWALIAPLTEEFFSGAGAREVARTMFAVGDPKQSIYSFQGAAPEQFLAESQTLSSRAHAAGAAFVAPSLDMSFRSAPQILAAVDATFDGVDLAGGRPGAFDVVRHVARRENEGGVVEVWPIAPRPQTPPHEPWDAPLDNDPGETAPAALARALARNVRDWIDAGERVWDHGALRPMRAGDVLALVRQRGVLFRALLRAFKREGLPVAGADRITLRDEIAVEDCLALMRVALDCSDDLSVACVLKGPWLNLTDEDRDLFPLAYERGEGETLHTRVMASADPRHRPAQALLAQLADHAGDDPFAFLTFVLDHVDETGASGWRRVFARLGREARDPLEEMLERALARRSDGAETLHRFLADIEHDDTPLKREMEEAGDAIRIMTVHGAKGLEAPVVLLPDTTGDIKDAPDSGVIHGEDGLYWSPSAREDDAATTRARAAYEEAALGEHWRLLYVAMTRARDRLIVAGYGQGQGAGAAHEMSWHTRVSAALAKIAASVETPFGEGLRLGAAPAPSPAHAPASAQIDLPAWARTPVAPPGERAQPRRASALAAMLSPRANEQTRFARGRLIHGLLERLPDVALPDRAEAAQAWLHRQGVDAEVAAALTREALAVIEAPDFAPLFGPESRAEAPIVGEIGARRVRGIVDRLVVTPHEVLIVDFKSDRAVPARAEDAPFPYVLQMALYAGVLAQIFPQRRVRTALIWTERPLLVELPEAMLAAARSAG